MESSFDPSSHHQYVGSRNLPRVKAPISCAGIRAILKRRGVQGSHMTRHNPSKAFGARLLQFFWDFLFDFLNILNF
jgi:hypothetical protein